MRSSQRACVSERFPPRRGMPLGAEYRQLPGGPPAGASGTMLISVVHLDGNQHRWRGAGDFPDKIWPVLVLAIVHQPDAGPGVFAQAIQAAGGRLEEWSPARSPDPPRSPGDYDAVIALGGAMHADQNREHPWLTAETRTLRGLLDAGTPVLGVCL